jgi:catalase
MVVIEHELLGRVRDAGRSRQDAGLPHVHGDGPNSVAPQPEFAEPPLPLDGAADHWNHRADEDYYSQPGKLFRLMSAAQQAVLFANTARAMGDAPREVKIRHIGNCLKADPAYGKGVADALRIPLSDVPK